MKALQKITSVFLAAIFLVSGLGFTANKMVCLKSGKTKLSFVNFKDCCPKKKSSTPVIKSDCCDITNTFFHLGDFQSVHKHQFSDNRGFQYFAVIPNPGFNNNFVCHQNPYFFADLPPPLSGRKLLSFISILII
jgi:hypothetical protein